MTEHSSPKFVIRTPDGKYLSGDEQGLRFVNGIYSAILFEESQVSEVLAELRLAVNFALEAMPLKLEEVFETCDRCEDMVIPQNAFFDGQRFLCMACRDKPER